MKLGGQYGGRVISQGTSRQEDLFARFTAVLAEDERRTWEVRWEFAEEDPEQKNDMILELIYRLSEIAPAGHTFGCQPGTRTTFGFWPVREG